MRCFFKKKFCGLPQTSFGVWSNCKEVPNLPCCSDNFVYAPYTAATTLTEANMNLNYAVEQD